MHLADRVAIAIDASTCRGSYTHMMMRRTIGHIIGVASVAGLLAILSSCSTAPTQEAVCAAARDEKNAAVDARFNAISQALMRSWKPDIGKRPGALRTLQVSLQLHQSGQEWQHELNYLAYQNCLGGVV